MSLLEINNLNISYKTRKETIVASSNVNLILERGQILGIVGESGSGKSTIANAIINLIDPPGEITSGLIKIDNIELQNNEEIIQKIRGKKIGFVFQDPQTSLNPLFKIKDQLIETIQTHLNLSYEEALERSINLLQEVGIENAEKAVIAYGGVQIGQLEKNVSWISLFIALAPMLGFMGTVIGMIQAFDKIEAAGDMQPSLVAGGIKVALLTTVFGLIVAIILQVFYNYIVAKIDSIVNDMEDASITLIDILSVNKK